MKGTRNRHASIAIAVFAALSLPTPMFSFFVGHGSVFSGMVPRHGRSRSVSTAITRSEYRYRRCSLALKMNMNSDDPFEILGLGEPTADLKVIKRAYKRMALKFHPDMSTTKDSSPEEKKKASDHFAKINWAYSTLSGKRENDGTYQTSSNSASGSASSTGSYSGWTPPHRRSGPASYSSSSSGSGTSWEDFMPKYDQEQYDTGGDSFSKIFSDMFVGAAAGASGLGGGGGIFKDFVEFLEGNIDGYGFSDDDSDLKGLLNTASVDEIGNEMDDTELVVKQLKYKLNSINDEILTTTAEVKVTARYLEKMGLEESLAELNARKNVVDGYLKKAQKRALALQTRYKELIARGENDSYAGGKGSESSWDDIKREATSSSTSSSSTSSSSTSSTPYSTSPDSNGSAKSEDEDAWKNEGFGGSGRGRGSRRGSPRRRAATSDASSAKSTGPSSDNSSTSSRRESSRSSSSYSNTSKQSASSSTGTGNRTASSSSSSSTRTASSTSSLPPHRRTSSFRSQEDDKRRLRELKVDDEFDKLKKELGL